MSDSLLLSKLNFVESVLMCYGFVITDFMKHMMLIIVFKRHVLSDCFTILKGMLQDLVYRETS